MALEQRVDRLEEAISNQSEALAALLKGQLAIREILVQHEARFDRIDARFDRLEQRMDGLEQLILDGRSPNGASPTEEG